MADYYDARPLRDALKRQLKLQDFLWEHKEAPADKDEVLYVEATKSFRLKSTKEGWTFLRGVVRARPRFMRWSDEVLRGSEHLGEYSQKALLAHYLLRQACEEGVYNRRGSEYFRFMNSRFQLLEVSGYRGSKAALKDYLSKIIDKEGELSRGGITELREWLREYLPQASVRLTMVPGASLFDGSWFPAVGLLYQPDPNTYRIYLLGSTPKDPRLPNEEKVRKIFAKQYAYRLAVSDYLPKVESVVNEWKFNMETAVSAISVPGVALLVPEVEVDTFVMHNYPDEAFKEFEDHRTRLETYVLRAAAVCVQDDAKAAKALIEEVRRQGEGAKTVPVQNAYKTISERLSKKFKPV